MFNHSHIRHFSSVFVSLRDFELITQNSSENITSRQSRCIYVNECYVYMGRGGSSIKSDRIQKFDAEGVREWRSHEPLGGSGGMPPPRKF